MAHKISKLKNGLTLITVPLAGTKATTVLVMIPVGSRYESRDISGVSHFVEHMMFKGTAKRPIAQEISRELDAVGADYNAFTAKEYTGYYVKIDGAKQALAFELLSDMLFHSKMEKAQMEKERNVIVEELRMYDDNPSMKISLLFDRLLFGDCPLGWDEGGSSKTVLGMDRAKLFEYYQSAYSTDNMVLVVAGNVDKKKLKVLVNKYYTKHSKPVKNKITKNNFTKFIWPTAKIPLEKRVEVEEKPVDQAHVILGFPGLHSNHPGRFAEAILLYILGSGMSSRLFVEVREKLGLAYMVHAASTNYRDAGMAYVRAGLNPAKLGQALQVIKAELKKMGEKGVTAKELTDAKNSIAGRMALSMEESNAQADWYAKQFWFMDKVQTPDDVLKKIRSVTVRDVKATAKQLFNFDQMRVAVIGPVKKSDVLKMF
ncbi:MAG: pitrilysin family protein [bacterium]|nr:pitrilysin family protein [bacterium]